MNQVTLSGYIGSEINVANLEKATVANFSLATTKSFKRGDQWEKVPVWHSIRLWNHINLHHYLTKGSKILITGELMYDQWNDKTSGNKMTKAIIEVTSVELLMVKDQDGSQHHVIDDDMPF